MTMRNDMEMGRLRRLQGAWDTGFNPRSREGSDAYVKYTEDKSRVSIHAPAKGATDYS